MTFVVNDKSFKNCWINLFLKNKKYVIALIDYENDVYVKKLDKHFIKYLQCIIKEESIKVNGLSKDNLMNGYPIFESIKMGCIYYSIMKCIE
jgi:hypothetical protein